LGVGDVPSSQPKVQVTEETWEPDIGPIVIGDEVHDIQEMRCRKSCNRIAIAGSCWLFYLQFERIGIVART
jgi:hypothetical protein